MRAGCALLAALVLFVSGCGGGDDSDDSDQAEITAVLEKLFAAQEQGDAETACREVYVIREPSEREGDEAEAGEEAESDGEEGEAGVEECEVAFEHAMQLRQQSTRGLTTEVGAIEVDGDQATAVVQTELERSDGSALSQEVPYELVRTPEGWRVRISEEG